VIAALPSQGGDRALAMLLLARLMPTRENSLPRSSGVTRQLPRTNDCLCHYLRATILQEQGCLPEAFSHSGRPSTRASICGRTLHLGNLALKHGRTKESEKHFENALLLLAQCEPEDIVPESEGLSAGRLREMIVFVPQQAEISNRVAVGLCM